MPALLSELRNKLEKVVVEARDVTEAGGRIALESLAVQHYEPYSHMNPEQRKLRNRLRARARQLGDEQEPSGRLQIWHLVWECAYEHWHRMLFARFLAENNLLIEPEMGIAITMDECEELAREAGDDPRAMAARFAQTSLPQIFREGDPVLELSLPPETQQALDRLLDSLSTEVFTADDSLGWTYQFWQSKRKDEVNASGNKIGADELPAVTQLFTEHYMVLFLYHNTIGAWHAGKVLAENPSLAETPQSEEDLRQAVRLRSQGGYDFEYLRFVREAQEGDEEDTPTGPWRPAAGTFEGWPKSAKELKVLDPCCGSGHFLIEGFELLVRLRMDEEGLDLEDAINAVLEKNLHGLELDPRCTQIAAFNLAMAAWKLKGKPIELPALHIACSGLAVGSTKTEWTALAGDDPRLRAGMERLYDMFEQAPVLGSLIDPKSLPGDLLVADFAELQPLLQKALEREREDDEKTERAVAAQGMAKAGELLASEYTLAITNVPYLGFGKQVPTMSEFITEKYPDSRHNLATAFLERCLAFCQSNGTIVLVTPQDWLFAVSYSQLRSRLLSRATWNLVVRLGAQAFRDMNWWAAVTVLVVLSSTQPSEHARFANISASATREFARKAPLVRTAKTSFTEQIYQLRNPDHRLVPEQLPRLPLLSTSAHAPQGMKTGDDEQKRRYFWEVLKRLARWRFYQTTPQGEKEFDGHIFILDWDDHGASLARLQGESAWRKNGVAVGQMNRLPASLYIGDLYDSNINVIVPKAPESLPAIWAYLRSPQFREDVRRIDQRVAVTNATMLKVPFDLKHWQEVAAKKYPDGLPEPQSDDATQWLFHGHPAKAEPATVLQVAVGRLLGYHWPPELDSEMRLADEAREWVARCDALLEYADEDGIVCIPSIRAESPAAERVRALLAAALGEDWTPDKERELIAETGSKATELDSWLRNDFFEQHCKLFHHRPFVWHIWDGRKRDGFHALVNYHKLAEGDSGGRRTLEKLIYSYLGDWITRQKDGVRQGVAGAEDRLAAALELKVRLEAILEGEPPFDLFVRWKSLDEQVMGWEPDITDGVRLNIRPFMADDLPKAVCTGARTGAGILRWKPNTKWGKDRGKEPQSLRPKAAYPWFWSWDEQTANFLGGEEFDGNRWNDLHYTNELKRKARESAARSGNE